MKKYYGILKILEQNKIDMTKLYLLECLNMSLDNKEEEWKAMNYCYDIWLDIDQDISLGRLADIVADRWNDIKKGKVAKQDIINILLEY